LCLSKLRNTLGLDIVAIHSSCVVYANHDKIQNGANHHPSTYVFSSSMVTSLLSLALTRHSKQTIKSDIENNRLEDIILLYVVLLLWCSLK